MRKIDKTQEEWYNIVQSYVHKMEQSDTDTLKTMVNALTATCRALEERVRILELSRAPAPTRARKRPAPRRMITHITHRAPMVHLSPCTITFHQWITRDGFQPYIDLNYYFTYGFLAGIYHTVEMRIQHDKKHSLPLCTIPLTANRVIWMVYDTISTGDNNISGGGAADWKEATQETLHQLYYYAVFETEKAFNVWDMEFGEDMMTKHPDKYASYVINISGRHQGESKAKQELGRKLIEWCRPP